MRTRKGRHTLLALILLWLGFATVELASAPSEQITKGVNYLKSNQNSDGSWGGSSHSLNSVFAGTAAALQAVRAVDLESSSSQTSAIQFLNAQTADATHLLAQRIVAVAGAGVNTSLDLDVLLSAQALSGGWGTTSGLEGNVLDTSLALLALKATNSGTNSVLGNALGYLTRMQNADGGWGLVKGEDSQIFYTALALQTLDAFRLQFPVAVSQERAIAYLRGKQNADNGYGSPASTSFETAAVLLAILDAGLPLTSTETRALAYLDAAQLTNGSWANDAYSTALALRALVFPRDTDADGMTDSYETANGLSPNDSSDATGDKDGDGLTNLEEFRLGTKANSRDTDGDGVDDRIEVLSGSNPLDASSKNRLPQITSSPKTIANENLAYSYQVEATDPDGDTLSFSLVQSPGGMTITPAGLVQWTPSDSQTGKSTVIVKVADGKGGTALQQYSVAVLPKGTDLSISAIDTGGITTDTQTLVMGGTIRVDVQNKGGSSFNGSFEVLLFEDSDKDGTFQGGADNILGSEIFSGNLGSNAVAPVNVRVSGLVSFRDNLIYALVDGANQISELDENNNLGNSGLASKYLPPPADFQPKVKWQWDLPGARGIFHPPLVAPLTDTNGDGLVNSRDVPAVILVPAFPDGNSAHDMPTALRGDTGAVIFSGTRSGIRSLEGFYHAPAVGDIDGDGKPEIVVRQTLSGNLHCFNNDGTLRWTSPEVTYWSHPVIADLDSDGKSEILFGTSVFNFDGTIRWDRGRQLPGYLGGISTNASSQAADLDLDGKLEVIAGPSAIDKDGNLLWSWSTTGINAPFTVTGKLDRGARIVTISSTSFLGESYTAVANLDSDPNPEIIAISREQGNNAVHSLWIFEHDGSLKNTFELFHDIVNQVTYEIGPPTVADFDGDGQPEIALPMWKGPTGCDNVADPCRGILAVYEYSSTGTLDLKWQRDLIRTASLNFPSAASAFDFDGDGAQEIVYLDGQKLYIMNGTNGATLFEMGVDRTNDAAGMGPRYPTIADLDNDGGAEIIVPTAVSYVAGSPQRHGILVLGDTKDNWLNSRRVWNQWQYHITNVGEDAGIPRVAKNNWQTFNNHRTQSPIDGLDRAAAPDLTVSKIRLGSQSCPASLGITARIGNGGSLHVASGITANFYNGDPGAGASLLGSRQTTRSLYPGEFEDLTLQWNAPISGKIFVTINDPPAEILTQSSNLSSLPHTWAQASGFGAALTIQFNSQAYHGIDGLVHTGWSEAGTVSTGASFYEVRFPFPVNATRVGIDNNFTTTGFLAGTLTFSNGFSTAIALNSSGEGLASFPEQQNITWIRLTASSTKANGASVSEFSVAGSYIEPKFRLNEGTGRLANNMDSLGLSISPCDTTANLAPRITSAPPIKGKVGLNYTYQVQASDPNSDVLGFSLVAAPTGMTISSTGSVAWTPANAQSGNSLVTVQVSDGRGGTAEQSFTINVVSDVNRAPQITSLPGRTGSVGQMFQYDVNATDADGDTILYSFLQSPAGAGIELFTGLIAWTPGSAQIGAQFFTVEAQDGKGGRASQSFAVDVRPSSTVLPSSPKDQDGDGFDETVDCNDNNANVNPGRTEIPGNGLDDDCNSATPDTLPASTVSCSLVSDRRNYNSNSLAQLKVTLENLSSNLDVVGLEAELTIKDEGGQVAFTTPISVGVLSPKDLFTSSVAFSTQTRVPGKYQALLILRFGGLVVCQSQASFDILSSDTQGKALTGSISASPARIETESTFSYQVRNQGNVNLPGLNLKILVVHLKDGTVARTLTEQVSLSKGQVFSNTKTFSALGVKAGDYLAILQGESGGMTQTVDAAPISIVGQPKLGGPATPGVDASGFYVDVRFTNSGSFNVRNIVISQLILRTLSGTGTVTYNTGVSPPLPRAVGDLDVGASITVRLYLNRPSTVTRFSITEAGSMQSEAGTSYNYSMAQSVIP